MNEFLHTQMGEGGRWEWMRFNLTKADLEELFLQKELYSRYYRNAVMHAITYDIIWTLEWVFLREPPEKQDALLCFCFKDAMTFHPDGRPRTLDWIASKSPAVSEWGIDIFRYCAANSTEEYIAWLDRREPVHARILREIAQGTYLFCHSDDWQLLPFLRKRAPGPETIAVILAGAIDACVAGIIRKLAPEALTVRAAVLAEGGMLLHRAKTKKITLALAAAGRLTRSDFASVGLIHPRGRRHRQRH